MDLLGKSEGLKWSHKDLNLISLLNGNIISFFYLSTPIIFIYSNTSQKSFMINPQQNYQKTFSKIKSNSNISAHQIFCDFLQRKNQNKLKNNFTEKQISLQRYGSLKQLQSAIIFSKRNITFRQKYIETVASSKLIGVPTQNTEGQKNAGKYKKNLKQTTSTSSAETWKLNKTEAPSFIKAKKSNSFLTINKKVELSNFKIISKLGSGKFGKVFLAKEIQSGFVLALKMFDKQSILEQGIQQFIRQLKIQSFLSHPNIIQIYGFFHDQKNVYVMMELGCDGHLYSFLEEKKKLSQQATSYIAKSLLKATNYMHSHHIIHRDLKPENIVLTVGNVKICDFGWAVQKQGNMLRSTFCGTPLYLSPELLKNQGYDEKADIWAIGVLAFELLVGCPPFKIKKKNQLYKIITDSVSYPESSNLSKQFIEFMSVILNKDPQKRMSSSKLIRLEFIRAYSELETCSELCR